ncbi:MAG: amidohydrolase family protein [Acidimicrobiia bacterium]
MPVKPTIPPPRRNSHAPTAFVPPPGSCDAHCHVFGPASKFPYSPKRTYTPPDSGYADLVELQARLGLDRAVVVQASCHGTDNSALLDALRTGRGRFAGVAMIDDSHTDDELAQLDRAGVRAIRFNFVRHLGGGPDIEMLLRLVERVAPFGWHLDLHFDAEGIVEHQQLLESLPVSFIVDHMARVTAGLGIDQPPFQALLALLERNKRAWVKISGAERITELGRPPYDDVVPFARAVIAVAPNRVLWGTDWPHPNVRHMPDDGDLVDLLAAFAPDEEVRNRILVANPERLYRFSTAPG